MPEPHKIDAYAASILARMEPHARASLDESQEHAIVEALVARDERGAHWIDVRRVLPLYFANFYFVIQLGRDRRMGRRRVEYGRRLRASFAGNVAFFVFAVSPLIMLALIGLYFLKVALSIDLFQDFHLPNLLELGRK